MSVETEEVRGALTLVYAHAVTLADSLSAAKTETANAVVDKAKATATLVALVTDVGGTGEALIMATGDLARALAREEKALSEEARAQAVVDEMRGDLNKMMAPLGVVPFPGY
jgi:ABC-type transporter Mla subunit MlaD